MSSSKKRKSNGCQQTISKFFKSAPQERKPAKKIPVISIADDVVEICDNEDASASSVDKENSTKTCSMKSTVKKSVQKLQKYDINSNEQMKPRCEEKTLDSTVLISDDTDVAITNCAADKKKFTSIIGIDKSLLTPLEKQYVEIKKNHEDAILFVECGYKYRFFGNDAEVAAKELNIFTHKDHSFMTASIPVHRLEVHMERLLSKGYKVGVVEQTETAALKAVSSNKNAPFVRKLTRLYTQATYTCSKDSDGQFILALSIHTDISKNVLSCDIVAVNPTTGQIVHENCDDNLKSNSSHIESIFNYLNPAEVILHEGFNYNTELGKFIQQYSKGNRLVRVELIKNLKFVERRSEAQKTKSFALLYSYLSQFDLQKMLMVEENYQMFRSVDRKMKLNHSVFKNLEIFTNNLNKGKKDSLFGVLDHTITPFGQRMLKSWLQQPSTDVSLINKRLDAIVDLLEHKNLPCFQTTIKTFFSIPDLDKALVGIQLKRCKPEQFIKVLKCLEKLKNSFQSNEKEVETFCKSEILIGIFHNIPLLLNKELFLFLDELNESEGKSPNKSNLFKNLDKHVSLKLLHEKIAGIEMSLEQHRSQCICRILRNKHIQYKVISGLEYLIEVKNSDLKLIPKDWMKINSTKQFSRFRTPFVDENLKLLCQYRESLDIEANKAWQKLLSDFAVVIPNIKKAVNEISVFDCLLSLSKVSSQGGFVRPVFSLEKDIINISEGRHPVIESIIGGDEQFVPNDICLQGSMKAMLISGPNMGGKSSYIKQIAIIAIMAQIGCYVPASFCNLSIIDGIYTRMGASDCLEKGKSTFMMELEEASYIMQNATSRSLVILDELGRGTSTHDGTAIAYATLKYFIEDVQPFTLFVTHYTMLSEFEKMYPEKIKNFHMSFIDTAVESSEDQSIVFLYKLEHGAASKSYGLNVAKLAKINTDILRKAGLKSQELYDYLVLLEKRMATLKEIFDKEESAGEGLKSLLSTL